MSAAGEPLGIVPGPTHAGADTLRRVGDGAPRLEPALRLAALREHSLLSLSELMGSLSDATDAFQIADLALFNLMGQFGTSRGALWLYSGNDGTPVVIRAHGIATSMARAVGLGGALRQSDWTARELKPILVHGGVAAPQSPVELLAQGGGLAALAPVAGRSGVLGFVAIGRRIDGSPYGETEVRSLQAALAVVGVAVENLGLRSRLADNNRRLRRANNELLEADRLKSEIVSNVNHELRTPLTIMIANLELLQDADVAAELRQHMVKVVLDQTFRLNDLVQNLLTLSDMSRDALDVSAEPGDLSALLDDYCLERHAGANAHMREFAWQLEELPRARFDGKRLVQVLEALVDNAMKFTPEGARVELRAHRHATDPAWVVVEVVDDGPGIAPDRLPRLFEAFRQGDGSITREVGGLGLGLALSRQLVEAMGGRIEAESTPGKGTTISMALRTVLQRASEPASS